MRLCTITTKHFFLVLEDDETRWFLFTEVFKVIEIGAPCISKQIMIFCVSGHPVFKILTKTQTSVILAGWGPQSVLTELRPQETCPPEWPVWPVLCLRLRVISVSEAIWISTSEHWRHVELGEWRCGEPEQINTLYYFILKTPYITFIMINKDTLYKSTKRDEIDTTCMIKYQMYRKKQVSYSDFYRLLTLNNTELYH